MIGRIIGHEWRLLRRDGSLWLVGGLFALALAYGIHNGNAWVRFLTDAIEEAAQEERERHATQQATLARLASGAASVGPFQDPGNPQAAASRLAPRYAAMPPSPLAALSIGQSDLLPAYVKVTSEAREIVTAGAELENPHRLLTGRFDAAFVLVYLYPLLILALSYNVLSGEKEQGTLALALSQPLSLRTLSTGKLAFRFAMLLAVVLAVVLVALAWLRIPLAAPGVTTRLLWWVVAVVAYGLVWFGLAMLVASFDRPSSTNAMTLAALWIGLVVIVPSLLNMIATTLYPVPSRVEMIQAMRQASDEANAQGSALLSRYYEDHPELAVGGAGQAMNDFAVMRVAVDAAVEARVQPVLERHAHQLAGQQHLVRRWRFVSPAILMQDALNDLAGTGTARHRHFMQQVSDYHARWRAYFVPLIFRKARVDRYDALPAFSYEDEPVGSALRRAAASVVGLLVLGGLAGSVGWWRLRRFSVA